MSKENILNEVIIGYRNVIYQRYQYPSLQKKFRLPDSINEETVNQLREYFLNYIYPQFDKLVGQGKIKVSKRIIGEEEEAQPS